MPPFSINSKINNCHFDDATTSSLAMFDCKNIDNSSHKNSLIKQTNSLAIHLPSIHPHNETYILMTNKIEQPVPIIH